MPYYLERASARKNIVIEVSSEPKADGRLKARIAMGIPITEEEINQIPRVFLLTGVPSIGIPDIICWGGSAYVLSEQIRDKIEELEPGVHGFVPIQMYSAKKHRKDYGIYHLLLLTQAIDAVVMEGTRFRHGFGIEAAEKSGFTLHGNGPCVLDKAAIEGRHLWRGAGIGERWPDHFCSDELGEFIKERKMRGWGLLRCEVR